MLVELLSQSNYQSFNIKLAHLLGLETSIYLSALIDIKKGKSLAKDITISIFASFPIIFSIAMLILLNM